MIDDDDRQDLMTLATDDTASGRQVLDDADDRKAAALLHGLLFMFSAANREVHTELGRIAITVALELIASDDADRYRRNAAALILGHAAVYDDALVDAELRDLGAERFNDALNDCIEGEPYLALIQTVAAVWRGMVPCLDTPGGLAILRRVEW